jgi:hypothetical protein
MRSPRGPLPLAFILLLATASTLAQNAAPQLPPAAPPQLAPDNATRLTEFYRFAAQYQDSIWPNWSATPAPILLITPSSEFLTHFPRQPDGFTLIPNTSANLAPLYARAPQFPPKLQATMPCFGPPATIAIGMPASTESHDSSHWLIIVMHEHFHQLQWSQPGYIDAVNALGLAGNDNTGMWMLNYPFPYADPAVNTRFNALRNLLLHAVAQPNPRRFRKLARQYLVQRAQFFASLQPNDRKYLSFQLWQEGIARYTEIKSAEAGTNYQPTPQFVALADFQPFSSVAANYRARTLAELRTISLKDDHRLVVYPFGATEGLLLDRLFPQWKSEYFRPLLDLNAVFAALTAPDSPSANQPSTHQ